MLIYVATELTRMPAMMAYAEANGNVHINGSPVSDTEDMERASLTRELKALRRKLAYCYMACYRHTEERARYDRIIAAINSGHGR